MVRKVGLNSENAENELNELERKIIEQQNALKDLIKQTNGIRL